MSFQEDQSMDFFGTILNEMQAGAKPWQDSHDALSSAFVSTAEEVGDVEISPEMHARANRYRQRQLELEKSRSFRSRAKMLGRSMLRMFG